MSDNGDEEGEADEEEPAVAHVPAFAASRRNCYEGMAPHTPAARPGITRIAWD